MYVKRVGNDIILLVIYVDDIFIAGSDESAIKQIKSNMSKTFDMDLGLLQMLLTCVGRDFVICHSKPARQTPGLFCLCDKNATICSPNFYTYEERAETFSQD
jgi:hypothetical protein